MLSQLRIQNFKGWRDTGAIALAPLTLLFGANSSGKSSITQFLMLLKQTVELSDRRAVFYPGGERSAVQLGSYREMVFQRELANSIEFTYDWSLPAALKFTDPLSAASFTGDALRFAAAVGEGDGHQPRVQRFMYHLLSGNNTELTVGLKESAAAQYAVEATKYDLQRTQGRPADIKEVVRFYGFPDALSANYKNAGFLPDLNLAHEQLFESLCYLGPLRTKAARLYTWSGNQPPDVGYAGEHTIAALLAAKDRKIDISAKPGHRKMHPLASHKLIARWLRYMELIEAFTLKSIAKPRQEYEVKIKIRGSDDAVDLPDVGFGISQVLPVLVQCLYAPRDSIIVMEQPEIHLHPRAQAALADVLLDVIYSKENAVARNIQLIIETHSEHFLRRLQRRIACGVVAQDMVAAYFATPPTLERLQLDEYGYIRNWPDNFFGDEMTDLIEQSKAALAKRKRGPAGG